MARPDLDRLTPTSELRSEDAVGTNEIRKLAEDAHAFLAGFRWCKAVVRSYAGITIPGVVGVFLHQIEPEGQGVDEWLWTVVGDLPPAYIVTDDARNAPAALEAYIGEMRQWVEAVRLGQPVDELIPVNVAPTAEFASMLDSRLTFLEENVLSEYQDELNS
jgi:hypothetical protein